MITKQLTFRSNSRSIILICTFCATQLGSVLWDRAAVQTILSDIRVTCPLEHLFTSARLAFDSAHLYLHDFEPEARLHNATYGQNSRRGLDVAAILGVIENPSWGDSHFASLLQDAFTSFVHTHHLPKRWRVGSMIEIGQDLRPKEMNSTWIERCHFWIEETDFYPKYAKLD